MVGKVGFPRLVSLEPILLGMTLRVATLWDSLLHAPSHAFGNMIDAVLALPFLEAHQDPMFDPAIGFSEPTFGRQELRDLLADARVGARPERRYYHEPDSVPPEMVACACVRMET